MNEYWDTRYQAEGKIWGDSPSRTADYALKLFQANTVKSLLVPGSGYGRNTKLFSSSGISVTGVEISLAACGMALEFDPLTRVYQTSVLDMSRLSRKFNAVYCFNVLHLFREFDRKRFIRQCLDRTKNKGLMFFTVFSEKEPTYGKGASVEPDTFESKPGRPVHYFSDADLKAHFSMTTILETGLMEDEENHGEGPHTHILRYIYVRANDKSQ
ncbi:MAG: class I SAM-dependent methyltransferase [Dehalococcoidales bacterium]|nr:class I SAM-dependent methyltransferase [Dehalococcoidales bacterium]